MRITLLLTYTLYLCAASVLNQASTNTGNTTPKGTFLFFLWIHCVGVRLVYWSLGSMATFVIGFHWSLWFAFSLHFSSSSAFLRSLFTQSQWGPTRICSVAPALQRLNNRLTTNQLEEVRICRRHCLAQSSPILEHD